MFKKRVLALFVILQVVVTSLFPASAHAATYAPVVDRDWNSTSYCVSGVSNRFDAALGLIGQWGKKIQISNDMYVKLSNESSGGAFWSLADSMVNPVVGANKMATAPEGWGLGPISTVLWLKIVGTCWAEYGSPADWMWCTSVNQELIDNANRDFLKVLAGESLGGGGGTGTPSGNVVLEWRAPYANGTSSAGGFRFKSGDTTYSTNVSDWNSASASYVKMPETLTIVIPTACFGNKWDVLKDNYFYARVWNTSYTTSNVHLYVLSCDKRAEVTSTPGVTYTPFSGGGSQQLPSWYSQLLFTGSKFSSGSWLTLTPEQFTFTGGSIVVHSDVTIAMDNPYAITNSPWTWNHGMAIPAGSGGAPDNPNNWPDPTTPDPDPDPTNPEPDPEPPTPPEFDPPGFEPDVPQPDPTPTPVGEPTNTTAADYTPWLRAILTALNVIIDDMGEHCDHIRVAMRDYLNGLYEALSDDLQAYYDDLTDYLSDLAKWIVSHLNFDIKQPDVNVNVPGYDDSSVIGWLRRIYYKLRGTGTPRPDPIEDTDGAFDWWSKFLEWITNALGGLLTDFVGDLGGFLQELINTFPFSIPWDIVAMLTLLDAQRATPDVTFTIPGQNGWWDDITIRINLAAYDDAMATVRGMVLIWWMYILVIKTDWMMLLFDGANNAIGDFVSRLTGKG